MLGGGGSGRPNERATRVEIRRSDRGAACAQRFVRESHQAVRRAICSVEEGARVHHQFWRQHTNAPRRSEAIKRARARASAREALGGAVKRENATRRDAPTFVAVRDAKILVDALDELASRHPKLDRKAIDRLRSELMARRMRARRRVLSRRDTLEPVCEALRETRRRLPQPRGPRGWAALRPGLRRVYRCGRRAAAAAEQRPTDESLHESRKQANSWHSSRSSRRSAWVVASSQARPPNPVASVTTTIWPCCARGSCPLAHFSHLPFSMVAAIDRRRASSSDGHRLAAASTGSGPRVRNGSYLLATCGGVRPDVAHRAEFAREATLLIRRPSRSCRGRSAAFRSLAVRARMGSRRAIRARD